MARTLMVVLSVAMAAAGCLGDDDAPRPSDLPVENGSGPPGANDAAADTSALQRDAPVMHTDRIGPLRLEYTLDQDTPPTPIHIEPDAHRIEWTQWHNITAQGFHWSGIDPTTDISSGLYDANGTARGIAVWNQTFGVTTGSNVPKEAPRNGTIHAPEAGEWTFRVDGSGHNVHATMVAVVSYGER